VALFAMCTWRGGNKPDESDSFGVDSLIDEKRGFVSLCFPRSSTERNTTKEKVETLSTHLSFIHLFCLEGEVLVSSHPMLR